MSVSPTRGRGSEEVSKEEEVSRERRGGHSSGDAAPPLYPKHCPAHADVAVPGRCGDCKDTRESYETGAPRLSLISAANPARVPHCGKCDETRHLETPVGVIRCPECHPRAEEAS